MARFSPTVRFYYRGGPWPVGRLRISARRRGLGRSSNIPRIVPLARHVEGLRIANRPKAPAVFDEAEDGQAVINVVPLSEARNG